MAKQENDVVSAQGADSASRDALVKKIADLENELRRKNKVIEDYKVLLKVNGFDDANDK